ncbi:MAG: hypothetical protein JWL88_92 [Parcubacteria group bacterium]|nr:hypothetical protein [Parcubacteria group bacterium]
MERPPNKERAVPERFPELDNLLEGYVAGRLTLNEVERLAPKKVSIQENPNTWESVHRSNPDGSTTITIGLQQLPAETKRNWRWGAETEAEQYLVKLSHEYAHLLQETFDGDLLPWLDKRGTAPAPEREPYILLYALLDALKNVHGLSKEPVYHQQSTHTGNLYMPVYEDMAETFGAFFLSKDYLLWRLRNSAANVSEENVSAIAEMVEALYATWGDIQEQRQANEA